MSQTPRRALVTLSIGDLYQAMARHTHPLMQAYADKCGVEFVCIQERRVTERYGLSDHYEKFQLFNLLDRYDQILFVDTDILVSPHAPSLFELVPEHRFAAASEENYSQSARDKQLTQQILGAVDWINPYFNSGLMIFSGAHREVFNPLNPWLKQWAMGDFRTKAKNLLNDQPFLNHRLNQLSLPLIDLGYRFNHTRVIRQTQTRFHSYFIHYAGPSGHRYGPRIEQIRKDAAVFRNPAALWLSRRSQSYRWLADRLDKCFFQYLINERLRVR